MKFLRTIRFDSSDENVFESAAVPDEWAISGAFAFAELEPEDLQGKLKQEFANGFLGLESFGRSTFVAIAEISQAELEELEERLAAHFVEIYGAPSQELAREAAAAEISFIVDLCKDAQPNTLFSVQRNLTDKSEISEEFRTIRAPGDEPQHTKIWDIED